MKKISAEFCFGIRDTKKIQMLTEKDFISNEKRSKKRPTPYKLKEVDVLES